MSAESEGGRLFDGRDFAALADEREYAKYFAQLGVASSRLLRYYQRLGEQSFEARMLEEFLRRLLFTVDTLRLKFTYPAETGSRPLWVDVTRSGFPNHTEISGLAVDLQHRYERLRDLPTSFVLKRALVDHLFTYLEEPAEILAQLSQRTYLELLDPARLFVPFSPGEIVLQGGSEEARSYLFPWGCYDFQTNRPYIHLLSFEQSRSADPLENPGKARERFLEVLAAEGSRAPDIALLAMAIDSSLEDVHPKILKRVCLGPLYSPLLMRGREPDHQDPVEPPLRELFAKHYASDGDFALFFTDELVFSKRQEISRTLFSPKGTMRQIFAITESDPECYERRASVVHHHVLLPHRLLQHCGEEAEQTVPGFRTAIKITFDEGGEVHGLKQVGDSD